jgi:hypothetical protein
MRGQETAEVIRRQASAISVRVKRPTSGSPWVPSETPDPVM